MRRWKSELWLERGKPNYKNVAKVGFHLHSFQSFERNPYHYFCTDHMTQFCSVHLFLLHFRPHLPSFHASPFSLSSLPSCPHLIHLMAVSLTLAPSTEQINSSWKRPCINLLMISSFSWTHKCLPSGHLSPFGRSLFWQNCRSGNEHLTKIKGKCAIGF